MRNFPTLAAAALLLLTGCHHVEPYGPVPTRQQLAWQDMEMYAFIHYSMNTYTDQEWGFGNEDPALFNPSDLDCRQWARVCKQAGMKGIIFTAKHHCGFCMWPFHGQAPLRVLHVAVGLYGIQREKRAVEGREGRRGP